MMIRAWDQRMSRQSPSSDVPRKGTHEARTCWIFSSLCGGHWRAAEEMARQLPQAPVTDVSTPSNSVNSLLPSSWCMNQAPAETSADDGDVIKDLFFPDLRLYADHVLVAIVLQEMVKRVDFFEPTTASAGQDRVDDDNAIYYMLPQSSVEDLSQSAEAPKAVVEEEAVDVPSQVAASEARPVDSERRPAEFAAPSTEERSMAAAMHLLREHTYSTLDARWNLFWRHGYISVVGADSFEHDIL